MSVLGYRCHSPSFRATTPHPIRRIFVVDISYTSRCCHNRHCKQKFSTKER